MWCHTSSKVVVDACFYALREPFHGGQFVSARLAIGEIVFLRGFNLCIFDLCRRHVVCQNIDLLRWVLRVLPALGASII